MTGTRSIGRGKPFNNHDILDVLESEVSWICSKRHAQPILLQVSSSMAVGRWRHHVAPQLLRGNYQGASRRGRAVEMQRHFCSMMTGPDDRVAILERFAKFQKPIWATEHDD
jgi:hypothetical protein